MNLYKKVIGIINSHHVQSLIAQGFTALFGFVSIILLARNISPSQFGQWVLFLSIVMFVEMLKSGMFQTALIKYISGATEEVKEKYLSASLILNFWISLLIFVLGYLALIFVPKSYESVYYFLIFYPLIGLFSIPFNYALWLFQSEMKFKKIVVYRGFQSFLLLSAIAMIIIFDLSLLYLYIAYTVIPALLSLSLLFKKEIKLTQRKYEKSAAQTLFDFGKYHVFSFLGTNLLKSADVWLISIFLGPAAVAIYNIPLKLIEIFEIPVRSAVSTALPKLSALHNNHEESKIMTILKKYIGVMTLITLPVSIGLFVFAPEVISLFAGDQYADSVIILRVFLLFTLFLPLDRMTGVALIAINLPKQNLWKVVCMAGINVVGDVVVLYYFHELWTVALVTIVNTIAGAYVGYLIVNKNLKPKIPSQNLKTVLEV